MANKPIEYGLLYSYIGEAWRGPGYSDLEPKTVEAEKRASGITYRLLKALEKQGYQVGEIPHDVEVNMNPDKYLCINCKAKERQVTRKLYLTGDMKTDLRLTGEPVPYRDDKTTDQFCSRDCQIQYLRKAGNE